MKGITITKEREREEFEMRFRPHWSDAMFRRSDDNADDYADGDVDSMWQGWQAARATDTALIRACLNCARHLAELKVLQEHIDAMMNGLQAREIK